MQRKTTLRKIISIVKLSVLLDLCWPLARDVTKFKLFCVKLYQYFCIILLLCLAFPMMYSLLSYLNNPEMLINVIVMMSASFHSIFNIVFYRINYYHIQNVTFEMMHFNDVMKQHEKTVIQRYIDKYQIFYGLTLFLFYFLTILKITMCFVLQQPFPILAEYPFDVFHQPLKTIIFIQQSVTGMIISSQLCMNTFMALLLWFTSARFEILIEELETVTNIYKLYKCIKMHQKLLKYANEVAMVVRSFAFITICCSTVSLIVTCLFFITNQPLPILLQGFTIAIVGISEVFMYTWPAEHLMDKSTNIGQAAFTLLEKHNVIKMWTCAQFIIMQSQKPIQIKIPCLMPTLSFNYFSAYLSTIVSYFTALRVMLIDD